MAGEWIAVDIALPEKPEFQEIMDLTGRDEAWTEFLLVRLWGWASMHCADGTARMTIPRLVRLRGGDEAFWRAVAAVGWLEINEEAGTMAVPGWDRRFSQSAKARLQHRDRAAAQEESRGRLRSSAGTPCAQAQGAPALTRRRGEERTGEIPPPPREDSEPDPAAWETLQTAWNAAPLGRRAKWTPVQPPSEAQERFLEPGWLQTALEAIGRLKGCKYFQTPVPLNQFCLPGFAHRVVEGRYDEISPKRGAGPPEDKPPLRTWDGPEEEARRAMLRELRAKQQEEVANG
jgi:hypothetical protein